MRWLRRHAWWGLLFMSIMFMLFGVTDLFIGAEADPGIAVGLSGMSLAELEAESAAAYRLFDLATRANGWSLFGLGAVISAILVFGFRRDRAWAWWTAWILPIKAIGVFVFYVVAGTDPAHPPPPPMISGPIIAVLAAAILFVSAPRFFGSEAGSGVDRAAKPILGAG